jgi:hypothetical protein
MKAQSSKLKVQKKFQASSSKRTATCVSVFDEIPPWLRLELGAWDFFGAWNFGLGTSRRYSPAVTDRRLPRRVAAP